MCYWLSLNLALQINKGLSIVTGNTKSSLQGTLSLRGQMPEVKTERLQRVIPYIP